MTNQPHLVARVPYGDDPGGFKGYSLSWGHTTRSSRALAAGGPVRFSLDGEKFYEWDSPASDPLDRFWYLHVGSDPQFKGATPGPVFANVGVTSSPRAKKD